MPTFLKTGRSEGLAKNKEDSDMLVLSRKLGEKIVIGDNITITVVDIDRGKIRLGIEAPDDVLVDRREVRLRRCLRKKTPPAAE